MSHVLAITIIVCLMILMALYFLRNPLRIPSSHSTTHATVYLVAAQIAHYHTRQWSWQDAGGSARTGRLFDLDQDGLIDGSPGVTASDTADGGFPPEVIASGYHSFIDMTQTPIEERFVNPRRQPIDAWGRPLRIAFAAKIYGTLGFCVWSAGADGIDGTTDDLRSWNETRP